jgi:hypothetical protein
MLLLLFKISTEDLKKKYHTWEEEEEKVQKKLAEEKR